MRLLFTVLILLLSACYQPLYGNKGFLGAAAAPEARLNTVELAGIQGEQGQKLRNFLIDRFYGAGRPAKPRYRLDVRLTPLEEKLGLQKDATTTRARLTLTAEYDLLDTATRKILFTARSNSAVSHNILGEQYATLASKEDAYQRGLKDLAELITTRVLLYFNRQQ